MYSVVKKLGQGSFGKVYQCCKNQDSLYAVKVESKRCKYPQLHYEYRILKRLNTPGHQGIPLLHKYQNLEKQRVLVMELLGDNLESYHIKKRNPIKDLASIAIQVLDTLRYIHSRGILHGAFEVVDEDQPLLLVHLSLSHIIIRCFSLS